MLSRVATHVTGRLLSRSGRAAKLLILMYHRVLPRSDPLLSGSVDAATFEWQMALLAQRFTVLPLCEAATCLVGGVLPARTVCITFDDGYADNVSVALPILRRHDLTATFFIATGFLDGGRMWNDTIIESVRRAPGNELNLRGIGLQTYVIGDMQARRQTISSLLSLLKYLPVGERTRKTEAIADHVDESLPADLMMSSEQVRDLQAAGMEVGAHTANHPILMRLSAEQAEQEIRQSRARLHELGIRNVDAFAYPNGRPGVDYDRGQVEIVRREGFKVAVSTAWGCARRGADPLQLPRIGSWDSTPGRFYLRMLKTYAQRPAEIA